MPRVETLQRAIPIPANTNVEVDGRKVWVQGSLGGLEEDLSHLPIELSLNGPEVIIKTQWPRKREIGMLGTAAAHIRNMIKGVNSGYKFNLKTVYAHFPVAIKVDERSRTLKIENFTGEKTRRTAAILDGLNVTMKVEEMHA